MILQLTPGPCVAEIGGRKIATSHFPILHNLQRHQKIELFLDFPRFLLSRSYRGGNPTGSLNAPVSDWNLGFRGRGVGFRGPPSVNFADPLIFAFYISAFFPSGSCSPVALATLVK